MAKLTGGGILGNKVRHVSAPKIEPKSKAVSPEAAAGIGLSHAYKVPNLERGKGYSTPVGPSSSMGVGPGANRTVMKCGSQGTHGPVAGSQRPQGRGILNNE
jgi:hypothetical protein